MTNLSSEHAQAREMLASSWQVFAFDVSEPEPVVVFWLVAPERDAAVLSKPPPPHLRMMKRKRKRKMHYFPSAMTRIV